MILIKIIYTIAKQASQLNCPDPRKHSKSDGHLLLLASSTLKFVQVGKSSEDNLIDQELLPAALRQKIIANCSPQFLPTKIPPGILNDVVSILEDLYNTAGKILTEICPYYPYFLKQAFLKITLCPPGTGERLPQGKLLPLSACATP